MKKHKIKQKDLESIFYELNIMVQANLSINEALDILIKNKKEKYVKTFLIQMKSFLLSNLVDERIFKNYKFDNLVLAFLQLCKNKGNIKLNISALNTLLKEETQIKKSFYKSIQYPLVLILSFFISLNMIFYFVVPNFKGVFLGIDSLPMATKILFELHSFYMNYFFYLVLVFFLLSFLVYVFYLKNEQFKYLVHRFMIKDFFIFKDIYVSLQSYRVFLLLDIMSKSNYEFHEALSSCKVLIKNKYLLDRISLIENLLGNGNSIKYSFSKTKLFDDLILNLINTAEHSNSLDIILCEIKNIYKNRFNEKIKFLITIIEPIFIVFIMALILWIVFAIFVPIWDMGNMMKM